MKKVAPVHVYVVVVSALGLGVFGALMAAGRFDDILSARSLVFAAFVVLGELIPITVPRNGEEDQITTSTAFSLALLLTAGIVPAVLAQVVSSVIADLLRRKPLWKAGFNAAQYELSLCASAGVLILLTGHVDVAGGHALAASNLPAVLAAGTAFFLVNTSLTGTALALAQGVPLAAYIRRDLMFQGSTDGVLLALAPIVVLASQTSLVMVPLIAVPMVAVYKSAMASLENAALVRRLEESLAAVREMNRLNEHQALHDALTGLPNRSLFLDRVAQAIRVAHRDGEGLALLIIDLDRFKDINDTLGHHDGDLLLQQIGQRLQAAFRESDTIARLGGDEFGVLAPSVTGGEPAIRVADRIRATFEAPFEVEGLPLYVEASIGISLYPDHGADAETLIQRADLAMYVAKSGSIGLQVYATKYDQHSRSRLALLGELRRAIDEGQLILHYQPKVNLNTGTIAGVEALLRWQHPNRTLIPPDEFIPFAEHTGLIRPLTLFVIDAALRQAHEWRLAGLDLNVAVNLSARNVIDPQLPGDVSRVLERWGVPAQRLELEITESALTGEPVRAMEVLTRLNDMQVALSLDDFGTGYSSLASIRRLPVDEIKIDRSFVMSMASVESDAVIVRSTIDLGHNLGLRVVAEGVETRAIWDLLSELECDVAQGYFLSRPLPPADVARWIRDWGRGRNGQGPSPGRAVAGAHAPEDPNTIPSLVPQIEK